MKGGFSMCMVNEIVLCMKLTSDEQIYSLKSVAEVKDTFSQQDVSGITENSLKNEYYVTEHDGYTEMYKICSSDAELKEFLDNTENGIFANNAREPLMYASLLVNDLKRLITYREPNGGTI